MLIPLVFKCDTVQEKVRLEEHKNDFHNVELIHASCEKGFIFMDLLLGFQPVHLQNVSNELIVALE